MLKPCITLQRLIQFTILMLSIGALLLTWSAIRQQESMLAIHVVNQGVSMPDDFSIRHHLDTNGIRFESITLQDDVPLITFGSSAQNAAAEVVLGRTLSHGFITAQQDNNNQAVQRLSRLREIPHRSG